MIFHGADRELQTSFRTMNSDPTLQVTLTNDNVQWHFILPAAPHFGGLWEAGVKNFKFHLQRVIGSRTLSKAEFATLLCQIEACLNSRPIATKRRSQRFIHVDAESFLDWPAAHFGTRRVSTGINANRPSRWQLVQAMQEQIWRSWSKDYLHSLQVRNKWSKSPANIKINDLNC